MDTVLSDFVELFIVVISTILVVQSVWYSVRTVAFQCPFEWVVENENCDWLTVTEEVLLNSEDSESTANIAQNINLKKM